MLLLKCKNLSRFSNYTSITFSSLGQKWEQFIKILIILNRLFYSVALLQIVAICIEQIVCIYQPEHLQLSSGNCNGGNYFLSQQFFVLCLGVLLIYPGIFLRKNPKNMFIPTLRFIGVLGLLIQIIIVFICMKGIQEDVEIFPMNFSAQEAFTSIPSMIVIFNYHFKFFRFFKRLNDPCDKKMVIATVYGNSLIVLLYGGIGIFGYMTFGPNLGTKKSILNYFGPPYIKYSHLSCVLLAF